MPTETNDTVYGATFATYTPEQFREFVAPFYTRFHRNGLNPREVFEGKDCLDAGCGGGRGTVFMLENGARSVTAVDESETNVDTTWKNCQPWRDRVYVEVQRLEELDFVDNGFDFVWSNGVLQHTMNDRVSLGQLARVLKPGGQMWLYVYGAGGVYWEMVEEFRRELEGVPASQIIVILREIGYTEPEIAEYIDDWKVPQLRTYTHDEFCQMLDEAGLDGEILKRGTDYDTSERVNKNVTDRLWLGEGDIRVLATKREDEGREVNAWDLVPRYAMIHHEMRKRLMEEGPWDMVGWVKWQEGL